MREREREGMKMETGVGKRNIGVDSYRNRKQH
jgi:hypothetical protein